MHPEDLMKPDLLSEIVLLVSGGVMLLVLCWPRRLRLPQLQPST